jgi:predicted nucleic acid-binding protein
VHRLPRRRSKADARYTIDASVFVNAFNRQEEGHAQSFQILALIHDRADPIIVPTIVLVEIASAIARAVGDNTRAMNYARATATLPNLTLVTLTPTMAIRAAQLAVTHRLRGADSLYLEVSRRFATILITRDNEQLARGSAFAICQTPETLLNLG